MPFHLALHFVIVPTSIYVYTLCFYTHKRREPMRTNIVIDDQLLADAQHATGIPTKKGVVEEGLKVLLRLKKQESVRAKRGKLQWKGDLDSMRLDKRK